MTAPASPWWHPDRHADRRPRLLLRNRIQAALRREFDRQGFVETPCGILQVSPGNETHLHAFATARVDPAGTPHRLYLHTSPEFAAKKLLAAGESRLFDFARVFRNREAGPLHLAEFTMLEWYRAETPYDQVIADSLEVVVQAAAVADCRQIRFRDRTADPAASPQRLTVAAAFEQVTGIDLLRTIAPDGATDAQDLAAQASAAGIAPGPDDSWSDLFSRILSDRIEPALGLGRPTVLFEYPAPEAALARPCAHDPRVAERFELYVCGVELANGFGELTDPVEQRRRFDAQMDARAAIYGDRYPLDEDFLAALSRMPPASGVALGFDRLVMLVTGADRVSDVVWTPTPGL